jgi:hypothetical protein
VAEGAVAEGSVAGASGRVGEAADDIAGPAGAGAAMTRSPGRGLREALLVAVGANRIGPTDRVPPGPSLPMGQDGQ